MPVTTFPSMLVNLINLVEGKVHMFICKAGGEYLGKH